MYWIHPRAQVLSIIRFPIPEFLFKIKLNIEINLKNASFPPGVVEISFELNGHWDHLFSIYATLSEKHTFLIRTRLCSYQRVRNVSFLENFAYVLNEWTQYCILQKQKCLYWIFYESMTFLKIIFSNIPISADFEVGLIYFCKSWFNMVLEIKLQSDCVNVKEHK